MAKTNATKDTTIEVIIIVALMFFWFNILPVLYSAMQGDMRAFLSVLLGIVTFSFVGRPIMRWIK